MTRYIPYESISCSLGINGKKSRVKLMQGYLIPPQKGPTSLGRSVSQNPFEISEKDIKEIKPIETEIFHMPTGQFKIDNLNKRILGLKVSQEQTIEYEIANVLPKSVTIYIDMVLEERVFYGITFERLDKYGKLEIIELEGDLSEITSRINKMGYVPSPNQFKTALNLLVSKILKGDNGFEERGIFRKGVFYDEINDKLFLSKIENTKPESKEVKNALKSLNYYIQTLFRGNKQDSLGFPVYKELREIIVTCLKWSLAAPLGFATKMKYGENANKEFKYPVLLGDTDTYKTSILEMVLSIWNKYGKTVVGAGNLDTEKQLAMKMEESTIPFCGDEAGHILTQKNLTTLLKTATVDKVLRTRMYDGANESSLALRSPALTTNDNASQIDKTILNRYLMIVITYSMSFYKTLTKEEKERWKKEKIHFSTKLNPIARYLFWYFESLKGDELDKVMLGDNDTIGNHLLDELYAYADLKKPKYMNDYYVEEETTDDPELKDVMFIKDALQRYAYKYVKDNRYEQGQEEDAIQLIVSKSSWLYYNEEKSEFYLTSGVQHINQLQGMFTFKQLREKLGKKEVKMPKALHSTRAKSIRLQMEEFKELFL